MLQSIIENFKIALTIMQFPIIYFSYGALLLICLFGSLFTQDHVAKPVISKKRFVKKSPKAEAEDDSDDATADEDTE